MQNICSYFSFDLEHVLEILLSEWFQFQGDSVESSSAHWKHSITHTHTHTPAFFCAQDKTLTNQLSAQTTHETNTHTCHQHTQQRFQPVRIMSLTRRIRYDTTDLWTTAMCVCVCSVMLELNTTLSRMWSRSSTQTHTLILKLLIVSLTVTPALSDSVCVYVSWNCSINHPDITPDPSGLQRMKTLSGSDLM